MSVQQQAIKQAGHVLRGAKQCPKCQAQCEEYVSPRGTTSLWDDDGMLHEYTCPAEENGFTEYEG